MAANYSAYIPETFFESNGSGMGQVTILRIKSPQKVEAGVFLVDHFCLGVRDASYCFRFFLGFTACFSFAKA
jgi:hypothetical protein